MSRGQFAAQVWVQRLPVPHEQHRVHQRDADGPDDDHEGGEGSDGAVPDGAVAADDGVDAEVAAVLAALVVGVADEGLEGGDAAGGEDDVDEEEEELDVELLGFGGERVDELAVLVVEEDAEGDGDGRAGREDDAAHVEDRVRGAGHAARGQDREDGEVRDVQHREHGHVPGREAHVGRDARQVADDLEERDQGLELDDVLDHLVVVVVLLGAAVAGVRRRRARDVVVVVAEHVQRRHARRRRRRQVRRRQLDLGRSELCPAVVVVRGLPTPLVVVVVRRPRVVGRTSTGAVVGFVVLGRSSSLMRVVVVVAAGGRDATFEDGVVVGLGGLGRSQGVADGALGGALVAAELPFFFEADGGDHGVGGAALGLGHVDEVLLERGRAHEFDEHEERGGDEAGVEDGRYEDGAVAGGALFAELLEVLGVDAFAAAAERALVSLPAERVADGVAAAAGLADHAVVDLFGVARGPEEAVLDGEVLQRVAGGVALDAPRAVLAGAGGAVATGDHVLVFRTHEALLVFLELVGVAVAEPRRQGDDAEGRPQRRDGRVDGHVQGRAGIHHELEAGERGLASLELGDVVRDLAHVRMRDGAGAEQTGDARPVVIENLDDDQRLRDGPGREDVRRGRGVLRRQLQHARRRRREVAVVRPVAVTVAHVP
mmetsp:Transcript_17363/g.52848  ORF Transcript_17363/g.52848 Transcript_17363/m.52848 type:complete len:657 (+) Transcript_17363:873-2843(+)